MIIKQINKIKVELFEECELQENFNLTSNEINIILNYQNHFPELMQKNNINQQYCINARKLWGDLGKPHGQFNKWIERKLLKDDFYSMNQDYILLDKKVQNLKNGKNKGGRPIDDYLLTISCAKELSMQERTDLGKIVRRYFILMEQILKEYESWSNVRKSEKGNWNELSQAIKEWCISHNEDCNNRCFYTKEANMIYQILFNYNKASDVREILNTNNDTTRDHLSTDINAMIDAVQQFDIMLLSTGLMYDERYELLDKMCKNKYPNSIHIFNEFATQVRKNKGLIN